MHCKHTDGTDRAWFNSREEAEAFAADPADHPGYLGDAAHVCQDATSGICRGRNGCSSMGHHDI